MDYHLDHMIEKTTTKRINRFRIENITLKPFQTASIYISLIDMEDGTTPFYYDLTNEEYNNWSNDDNYLINLLKQKISP
jgi:hypothetical protein